MNDDDHDEDYYTLNHRRPHHIYYNYDVNHDCNQHQHRLRNTRKIIHYSDGMTIGIRNTSTSSSSKKNDNNIVIKKKKKTIMKSHPSRSDPFKNLILPTMRMNMLYFGLVLVLLSLLLLFDRKYPGASPSKSDSVATGKITGIATTANTTSTTSNSISSNSISHPIIMTTVATAKTTARTTTKTSLQSQHRQQRQSLKFVTVVLPSVVNPKGRIKRLHAITSTWGKMARAIYIVHTSSNSTSSNSTDSSDFLPGYQTVPFMLSNTPNEHSITNNNHKDNHYHNTSTIVFPQIMTIDNAKIATEEEGIPRLKYIIAQISKKYDPDFAFFVNDHTFIIPQHLCSFLESHMFQPEEHVYAGHALRPKNQKGKLAFAFNSGASGYFLSRKTMHFLREKWESHGIVDKDKGEERGGNGVTRMMIDPECDGNGRKWLQGNPGLVIAQCLKKTVGIDPIDTRDELKRHVFHAFGLIRVVKNEMDEWYERKHEDLYEILGKDDVYQHQLQKGQSCCSPETATFHYVEWAETLALWDILMYIHEKGANEVTNQELQQLLLDKWPKDKKDIGGYSHNLPPLTKRDVWDDLLTVIKAIAPKQDEGYC
jgi:hypothetical protein